jgi:hypothetical protein
MNLSDAIDLQVFHTMRMNTTQEVIDMYMMENAPKNPIEYKMGLLYIMETISTCQPNAFKDEPLPQRFLVIPLCTLRPIELVDRWIRLALLAIALNDYDTTDFYFMGALETVLQFRDDELLLLTSKLSFPVGVIASYDKVYFNGFGWTCMKLTQTILKHNEGYEKTPRKALIDHCCDYFLLLSAINQYVNKTSNDKHGVLGCATSIDEYNHKRFDMRTWAIDLLP